MNISRERLIELGYVAEPGLTSEDKIEASALAEHDRQVRRAAMLEVLELWRAPWNGEKFVDRLERMASE